MINIADSRFQPELLGAAKRAQKIDAGYEVPEQYRHNTPQRLEQAFAAQRRAGLFSEYPFGTDLTREEIDLARALRWLKENTAERARACERWRARWPVAWMPRIALTWIASAWRRPRTFGKNSRRNW